MATSKSSERLRYRYGICLNDGCSKCKAKEVQEIPARKEFVQSVARHSANVLLQRHGCRKMVSLSMVVSVHW